MSTPLPLVFEAPKGRKKPPRHLADLAMDERLELAKEAMAHGVELPMGEGFRLEAELNHLLSTSEDRAEGLAAFFAKRPPVFR